MAASTASRPPAPPRLSTIHCCSLAATRCFTRGRKKASPPAPALYSEMTRIGRPWPCAPAPPQAAASAAAARTASARFTIASAARPRARRYPGRRPEREGIPRGGELRVVALRDAPVVVAVGRPFPVVRRARAIAVAHALHFGGVLDARAERRDEIGEHVVARSVAARPPRRLEP